MSIKRIANGVQIVMLRDKLDENGGGDRALKRRPVATL
jgi:hypothetical protein